MSSSALLVFQLSFADTTWFTSPFLRFKSRCFPSTTRIPRLNLDAKSGLLPNGSPVIPGKQLARSCFMQRWISAILRSPSFALAIYYRFPVNPSADAASLLDPSNILAVALWVFPLRVIALHWSPDLELLVFQLVSVSFQFAWLVLSRLRVQRVADLSICRSFISRIFPAIHNPVTSRLT